MGINGKVKNPVIKALNQSIVKFLYSIEARTDITPMRVPTNIERYISKYLYVFPSKMEKTNDPAIPERMKAEAIEPVCLRL